jgi:hypothetical protein
MNTAWRERREKSSFGPAKPKLVVAHSRALSGEKSLEPRKLGKSGLGGGSEQNEAEKKISRLGA